MKKILAIGFCVVFVATVFLTGCAPIEQAPDQDRLDRIHAVEDQYVIGPGWTLVTAGVSRPIPTVTGMINLTRQGIVNGRLNAFWDRTYNLADGTLIPRYTAWEVVEANQHFLNVRFIADERTSHSDEICLYVIAADALVFNLRRVAGDSATNNNFSRIYQVFETHRQAQGQQPLTIEELPNAFFSLTGEDPTDLTVQLLYYVNGKNQVEFPFSAIFNYLTDTAQDWFAFTQ